MRSENIFRKKQRIDVWDDGLKTYYKGVILDVNMDENITLDIIKSKRVEFPLFQGDIRTFRIITPNATFFFESRVLEHSYSERSSIYIITWPEEIERVQQRKYFRFPCSFRIDYWVLHEMEPSDNDDVDDNDNNNDKNNDDDIYTMISSLGLPESSAMADISGGGLQMITKQAIPSGKDIAMRIVMQSREEKKFFLLKGRVVWEHASHGKKMTRYRYAVEFLDVDEALRDDIIRFIFLLSRERITM